MAKQPRKATTAENLQATLNNPNVRKFLDMLSQVEGTTTHGYNTTFGGGRVESLENHPNIQRDFKQTDGKTNTSGAAGRYQFLDKTWRNLQKQYPQQMPDFGERSQDFGAVALIAGRGALQDVVNGRFGTAVSKVGNIWASLPTSPYKQPKKSWDDVNKALGLQVPAGGAKAANAQALTPEQGKRLYGMYQAGQMSPEQRADYERDFATIQKPAGAKLLGGGSGGGGSAPKPATVTQPTATPAAGAAPYVLPVEIIIAYNNGSMTQQQRSEFERDYKAGVIAAPRHIPFELKASVVPIAERDYTGNRTQQFLDKTGEALSNAGRVIAGDGLVDAATALPRVALGGAQALVQGLGGLGVSAVSGLSGLGAGAQAALSGGNFAEAANNQIQYANRVLEPLIPQPIVAPKTTGALLEAMAVPMYATEAGGQANFDAYGNPLSAAAVQGLGDAGLAALGFRGVGKAPAPRPQAEPITPRPQAPAAPLATNPADLAAQAEAMPRPDVAPTATPQPRPSATGRTELTAENPTITIQPDGTPARPAPAPVPDAITDAAPTNQPIRRPEGKAFTTSQKPVAFEYDVVPIESVVKSTNADLTPNAAARPELQPRNRDTDASTAQINTITNLLNPEWLAESPKFSDGAPTVFGSEAVAGHGRLAAIERRYAQGAGAEYRAFVAQKAAELGVDPARLAGIERPVLVRRVKDEADALTIAQDSNAPTTLRMSPAEQARIDAPNLPDLDKLARGSDGEMNIPASYDFVRDFMGKLPVAERGDLMTPDGRISQTAVRRIQAAVAEKAYKDPDLIARFTESMGDEGKRISAALQKQAGAVAALAEAAAKGERYPTTLGADLAQAANKYADIKAAGSTVREYLDQGQLVDDGLSVGAREALEVMGENAKSGRAIGEYIQGKIAEVEAKGNPMQDSLFQKNKPQAQAIGERIAAQVKAAGRPADEATQAGKLAEAYYAATAKALGLTPDEVFAQVGLSVERGNVGGANAALRLGEREHAMVFGDNANASSFVHEAGHHFLETHAKLADESPKLQADVDAVMTWAGHDGRKWSDLSASQKREVHEKFAESFEQYLLTGKAPTKGLKGVFADFKQWLTDVYTSLTEFAATNPRADLSPEVMAVMDRMLGGSKAEKAANAARGKNRKKSAPITPELLDFKRSAPVSGGVSPALHQSRYDVLRDIGLTDGQIRGGSVEGDLKRLEWDAELAKYDTEYGVRMKEQLELERQKLREYGDGVVESMGGTAKATPETRGAAIVRPLEAYQAWYRDKIKAFYKQADEQGAMTGGIELRGLENKLKENSAFYNDALLSMRKSLKSFMFEQRLLDDRGNPKPMSAKQAEMVRKHLNSIRTFETSRVIGELNTLIDDAVFSTLNRSVYGEARAVNTQYHRIFSDPKGIARLLDVDGINRKISHEKVAANVAALAETDAAQFRHIMKQLESMPTPELQKMADQAIGEIRAQIAEKITAYDSTKPETVVAIGKALAPYRGDKLREIFGEKGAQKLETFVAAHGILRKVDAQPSGTASMLRNIATKGSEVGATMGGTAAGGALAGPAGAAAGAVIGQQIGAKIKGAIAQAVDRKSFGKAMSPRQLETMRQSYDASGRRLAALPETEAATAAAQAAPDSTRARVTNSRLERTKEWIAFYGKLTDEQKVVVKRLGAAAWLLSVGGSGDNQASDNGENR